MQRLAPYQSGLWLAEYINLRCQLCHVYRSAPQDLASWQSNNLSHTHNSTQAFLSRLHYKFNKGLLCSRCHDSIAWRPTAFTVDIAAGTSLPIQAATYYDYPLRQVIRAFKHHEDMTKLPLLVHVIRQLPRPTGCHSGNSVILPMPTTANRLVKRGFDPVTILSLYLSSTGKYRCGMASSASMTPLASKVSHEPSVSPILIMPLCSVSYLQSSVSCCLMMLRRRVPAYRR